MAWIRSGIIFGIITAFCLLSWYLVSYKLQTEYINPDIEKIIKMEKEGVPLFSSLLLNGNSFQLVELKGQFIIIHFWASWCNPCVAEFPELIKFAKSFPGKIIAINNDEKVEEMNHFLSLFKNLPKNFIILRDHDRKVANLYGVSKLPESFIVNNFLKLIKKIPGEERWNSQESKYYFEQLLNK